MARSVWILTILRNLSESLGVHGEQLVCFAGGVLLILGVVRSMYVHACCYVLARFRCFL